MKALFFFAACLLVTSNVQAQEIENPEIVILSKATIDSVASEDTYKNQTYVFGSSCKGITLSMAGRAQTKNVRQNFETGLNFKNNTAYTINLPDGVEMYGIQFAGFSKGDNWCYLYAYGPGEEDWEFEDAIGLDVKDNETIISQARYPLDPCVSEQGAPVYNNAGYTFASISFDNDPYTGSFTFKFSGNNQEQALIRIFTSKSAWDTYSDQCKAIDYGSSSGIVKVETENTRTANNVKYNIAGQRIAVPKGLYIMNGKTYIAK